MELMQAAADIIKLKDHKERIRERLEEMKAEIQAKNQLKLYELEQEARLIRFNNQAQQY